MLDVMGPVVAVIVGAGQAGEDQADAVLRSRDLLNARWVVATEEHVSQFVRVHGGQMVVLKAFGDSPGAGGHATTFVEFEGGFDGEGDD